MKKFYCINCFFIAALFLSCNTTDINRVNHSTPVFKKDLDHIQNEGKLKVLVEYNATSYFLYKGIPLGFEYELLKKYADHMALEIEVIPIKNMDSIFVDLKNGIADIVAANLTITEERLQKSDFTLPIITSQQVLIQRKPDNWQQLKRFSLKKQLLQSPLELIGKTITVSKGSSFYSRIKSLSNEIGGKIDIHTVSGEFSVSELIEKVATQEITYTIADKNLAIVSQWEYPNIDANLTVSLDQNIAWSTRKNSTQLTTSINEWLIEYQKTKFFNMLFNKYFKNQKGYHKRSSHKSYSLTSGEISPYDEIFQKNASKIGWDWELLTAMVYQESHFNNKARGWGGSFGLMQFMPRTGAKFGVDTNSSPRENILAGINYLKYLDNYWTPIISDSIDRIPFVIASYNVGPGHVLDARRLADKYGKDPFIWKDNVDYYLLNKSKSKYYKDSVVRNGYCKGFITYAYVYEILERYAHYKNITRENKLSNNYNDLN
jgi:membrane-bound lytic murein transglycosylase F